MAVECEPSAKGPFENAAGSWVVVQNGGEMI